MAVNRVYSQHSATVYNNDAGCTMGSELQLKIAAIAARAYNLLELCMKLNW